MKKERGSSDKKSDGARRLKVNVIYGDVPLLECMKRIISTKRNLR